MSPSTPYHATATLQAAANDREALARLVEAEQPALRAWLRRVLRDDHLTEDALQECWLTLTKGDWQFAARASDSDSSVSAWLRQIALRAALHLREDQRRSQRRLKTAQDLQPVRREPPTPLESMAEGDSRDLIWSLVADLPPAMRTTVELRFRGGLDFAAIGTALGS
jgi:RNA polymerase sigma factor (sigma-70 family)